MVKHGPRFTVCPLPLGPVLKWSWLCLLCTFPFPNTQIMEVPLSPLFSMLNSASFLRLPVYINAPLLELCQHSLLDFLQCAHVFSSVHYWTKHSTINLSSAELRARITPLDLSAGNTPPNTPGDLLCQRNTLLDHAPLGVCQDFALCNAALDTGIINVSLWDLSEILGLPSRWGTHQE